MNKYKDFLSKIEEITFEDIEMSNTKRENANVNGNSSMGTMLLYGSSTSKMISEEIISDRYIKAHKDGLIHIHDRDFYPTGTLTCCQIDLKKLFNGGFSTGHGFIREPQSIRSYASLASIAIQSNQNDQHGGQSIPAFDYFMADGVRKSFKKEFFKSLEFFLSISQDKALYRLENKDKEGFLQGDNGLDLIDMTKGSKGEVMASKVFVDLYKKTNKSFNLKLSKDDFFIILMQAYKRVEKETEQSMEAFVHNLNTMHSRAGAQVPFSSINFGTDTSTEGRLVSYFFLKAQYNGLGKGETAIFPISIFKVKKGINLEKEDPNYDLFLKACKVSSKRLFPNFSFLDASFNRKYYKKGRPETEISYMGCRTRTIANINGEESVFGRGNLSFTSINLPRIAIESERDLKKFFLLLSQTTELVIEQLVERFNYQANKRVKHFPFLMGEGVWRGSDDLKLNDKLTDVIKEGSLSIGFIGLAECLYSLVGEHHGESDKAQELGLSIVQYMKKIIDEKTKEYMLNFTLIATPAEGLSGRFVKMDREKYGRIPGVTDKAYYTNSFHIPVSYKISIKDKIDKESPYHKLTEGGHITYIELDGDPQMNQDAFVSIIKYMAEKDIGYGSINHPVDYDPLCGYVGIIGNKCPKCGREERENQKFDRIRRITGYLVGSLERFNDGKKAEVLDRVKHSLEKGR